MYHFILQILIMISLGLMVYMAARKIPQITDTVPEETAGQPTGFWHRVELILGKMPLDRFDLLVSQFLEKNIRKVKLLLARLDNYLTQHLEQFKKIKHRAHRKQEKKFALFEEQNEVKEGESISEKTITGPAGKEAEIAPIVEKSEKAGAIDQRVENTK
jgi:CHASE3 domain sensor protein